jgi:hypothetical protein
MADDTDPLFEPLDLMGPDVSMCCTCGAVVVGVALHAQWHSQEPSQSGHADEVRRREESQRTRGGGVIEGSGVALEPRKLPTASRPHSGHPS